MNSLSKKWLTITNSNPTEPKLGCLYLYSKISNFNHKLFKQANLNAAIKIRNSIALNLKNKNNKFDNKFLHAGV